MLPLFKCMYIDKCKYIECDSYNSNEPFFTIIHLWDPIIYLKTYISYALVSKQ